MTSSPNTPGFLGSVLAALVSFTVFGALVGTFAAFSADDPIDVLAIFVVYTGLGAFVTGIVGLPVAVVGTVLVAVGLRGVVGQGWHVLATGVAGAVLTPVYLSAFSDGGIWPVALAPGVGLAAAVGRTTVIPLVRSRRGRGRPIGLPDPAPVTLSRRALPMRADER